MSFIKAKWIVPELFRDIEPIDVRKYDRIVSFDEGHKEELRNMHMLFRLK